MAAGLPKFDLKESGLLRGLLDGTLGQVWEFWHEGEYPDFLDLKVEADRRTEEVLSLWSDSDFVELAKVDSWVKAGYLDEERDGVRSLAEHRRRRLAMRVVEIGLEHARYDLNKKALKDDPGPSDRVFEVVPGLWEALVERHFLLPITPERVPTDVFSADPFFYFGDYVVFPHPELRRNRELCFELSDLALATTGATVQVAIDPHRVLRRGEIQSALLEDYWYGLKLTRENLDSTEAHDLGRSVHWRNHETEEGQKLEIFFPLIATEFYWSLRDETVKVLQVEEVRPLPENSGGETLILNRYLHSERDTAAQIFTHLDGALKGYPAHVYAPSRDDPLARRGKSAFYRKLFRVDGEIPEGVWGMAVGQFFRHNELIAEHLGEIVDESVDAE